MNVVLIGAMMIVMMVFSHGGRHHEQPTAPRLHATNQDAPPPPVEDQNLSNRSCQPNNEPASVPGTVCVDSSSRAE